MQKILLLSFLFFQSYACAPNLRVNEKLDRNEDEFIDLSRRLCLEIKELNQETILLPRLCVERTRFHVTGVFKAPKFGKTDYTPPTKVRRPSTPSTLSSIEDSIRRKSSILISESIINEELADGLRALTSIHEETQIFTSPILSENLQNARSGFDLSKSSPFRKNVRNHHSDRTLIEHSIYRSMQLETVREDLQSSFANLKEELDGTIAKEGEGLLFMALAQNIRLAQYENILSQLKSRKDPIKKQERIVAYLNDSLAKKHIEFDDPKIQDIKEDILDLIEKEPFAVLTRGVNTNSASRIAYGYPGKPLAMKMKSRPENGFIPVKTKFTSKIKQNDFDQRLKFQKYSDDALSEVLDDGLPLSVAIRRYSDLPVKNLADEIEFVRVYESYIKSEDPAIAWREKEYIENHLGEYLYYHADPRSIEGVSKNLIETWRMTHKNKILNKKGPERVHDFLAFLNERGIDAKKDDIPLFISDLDLASIATKASRFDEDLSVKTKDGEGIYAKSQESFMKHRSQGFESLKIQDQVRHGPEQFNLLHPQELADDYPLKLILTSAQKHGLYSKDHQYVKGDFIYEEIQKGSNMSAPHANLFTKIQAVHQSHGLNILVNPADIIQNFHHYRLSIDDWIPEQKRLVKKFVDDIKTSPGSEIGVLYANKVKQLGNSLDFLYIEN